ncbi:MAG: hypothetical protein K0Q50_3180 [Vampirovibrio sp.]|jgi:hypothetical protein|nr:hypothetical protein [Vampirovibrio sp.]
MELLSQAKHYVTPAVISILTVSLLKMGIFVTHGDLEQSLRNLEKNLRSEYATRQDIEDIKSLLNRLDEQLSRLDDRLEKSRREGR